MEWAGFSGKSHLLQPDQMWYIMMYLHYCHMYYSSLQVNKYCE